MAEPKGSAPRTPAEALPLHSARGEPPLDPAAHLLRRQAAEANAWWGNEGYGDIPILYGAKELFQNYTGTNSLLPRYVALLLSPS